MKKLKVNVKKQFSVSFKYFKLALRPRPAFVKVYKCFSMEVGSHFDILLGRGAVGFLATMYQNFLKFISGVQYVYRCPRIYRDC
jgi:hypothetical protein